MSIRWFSALTYPIWHIFVATVISECEDLYKKYTKKHTQITTDTYSHWLYIRLSDNRRDSRLENDQLIPGNDWMTSIPNAHIGPLNRVVSEICQPTTATIWDKCLPTLMIQGTNGQINVGSFIGIFVICSQYKIITPNIIIMSFYM